ncbi:MAG: hypothetical protein Q9201_001719 [Fulgogasparrea decipioides]
MDLEIDEELDGESAFDDKDDHLSSSSTQIDEDWKDLTSSDDVDSGLDEDESIPKESEQPEADQLGERGVSALSKVDVWHHPWLSDDQVDDLALPKSWKSPVRWGANPDKDFA